MARAQWPLHQDLPIIQVVLTMVQNGQKTSRILLADTGAGSNQSAFELLLDETDCILGGGKLAQSVNLGGAYTGSFPRYRMRVEIPQFKFDKRLFVIGIPKTPIGLDGIACFRFLNRFTYGNFGNPGQFGLET